MINIVTAVSRPENLPRIHRSIIKSIVKSTLKAKWILIIDNPNAISSTTRALLMAGPFEVETIVHQEGRCSYGINQKNVGMGSIKDGFYHCLDDDNIVHEDFFVGLERAMSMLPERRAFVFGQRRWDNIKSLTAAPDRMEYGKIDNTMFVVHSSLIGSRRYDLSKSGSEDFHFFRKLYDLHPEEFVFLKDTLAYYNFIKHFPAETKEELAGETKPVDRPALQAPPAAPCSPSPRVKGVMKIALYSSKRDRCGISTYTSQLAEAFAMLGHEVRHFGSQPPYDQTFNEVRSWRPDVFHVQHESSIMPPDDVMTKYVGLMGREGIRTMITLHTEEERTIRMAREATLSYSGRIIMHRPTSNATDAIFVPMPCTVVGSLDSRLDLRTRFKVPIGAFVVSTVGFMIPWKDHPKIVQLLFQWMKEEPSVVLQVIASEHFNEGLQGYAQTCRQTIAGLARELGGGRIIHVDNYPSDRELVDRLAMSDLGYVWCPFDTGSSSAAAAQFTTARCPLVATDSSHYSFLGPGIVRGSKDDMGSFVELIKKTAKDSDVLKSLKANQWTTYLERNYIETARRHLQLYSA